MKFGILIVYDLTNDISYDAKLKRSKYFYFGDKIVKILWKKSREMGEYLYYPYLLIYWYKVCTVVFHISNKDISYDSKLTLSKK